MEAKPPLAKSLPLIRGAKREGIYLWEALRIPALDGGKTALGKEPPPLIRGAQGGFLNTPHRLLPSVK